LGVLFFYSYGGGSVLNIRIKDLIINFEISQTDAIIGVGSKVNNKSFVGFLDLDKTPLDLAEKIIKKLQEKHKLSDFLLFQSSPDNYHAICLECKSLIEWVRIEAPLNQWHAGLSLFKGEHVLRFSSKFKNRIAFIKIIPSDNLKSISAPHIDFFSKRFKLDLSSLKFKELIKGDLNYHFYSQKKRQI
jgi:hypothetical protein